MTRSFLKILCGLALPLAFLGTTLGGIANDHPANIPEYTASVPISRVLNQNTGPWLIYGGFFLYFVGMAGLFLYYLPLTSRMPRPGLTRAALFVALLGSVATLFSLLFLSGTSGPATWNYTLLSYGGMLAGGGLFALGAVRGSLMPQAIGITAVLSLTVPVYFVLSLILIPILKIDALLPWPLDMWLLGVLELIGLTALGLSMMVRQPQAAEA